MAAHMEERYHRGLPGVRSDQQTSEGSLGVQGRREVMAGVRRGQQVSRGVGRCHRVSEGGSIIGSVPPTLLAALII